MGQKGPLSTPVSPADQALAARLGLASIDSDSARYRQALTEIVAGGMDTALAVISVVTNHLASGVANAIGVTNARSLLEAAILDANQVSD